MNQDIFNRTNTCKFVLYRITMKDGKMVYNLIKVARSIQSIEEFLAAQYEMEKLKSHLDKTESAMYDEFRVCCGKTFAEEKDILSYIFTPEGIEVAGK